MKELDNKIIHESELSTSYIHPLMQGLFAVNKENIIARWYVASLPYRALIFIAPFISLAQTLLSVTTTRRSVQTTQLNFTRVMNITPYPALVKSSLQTRHLHRWSKTFIA